MRTVSSDRKRRETRSHTGRRKHSTMMEKRMTTRGEFQRRRRPASRVAWSGA
jgi:hypothetical protein